MQAIENQITEYIQNASKDVQHILFYKTETEHPAWSDNVRVLHRAEAQILKPFHLLDGEETIAYIGMHALILFIKRSSVGLIITNKRIFVQGRASSFSSENAAISTPFLQTDTHYEVAEKAWLDFMDCSQLSIPQNQLHAMKEALHSIVGIVLPEIQKKGGLPNKIKPDHDGSELMEKNISKRILELNLTKALKPAKYDQKNIDRVLQKFHISDCDVMYSSLGRALVGAPYGLLIGKSGITSRDAWEDCVQSSWDEIAKNKAIAGENEDQIVVGNAIHFIPSYYTDNRSEIIALINEIATGKIILPHDTCLNGLPTK